MNNSNRNISQNRATMNKAYNAFSGEEGTSNKMVKLIITRAIENNIPVHEDKELLSRLAKLELMQEMPKQYYAAIADIMAYIYKVNSKFNSRTANA